MASEKKKCRPSMEVGNGHGGESSDDELVGSDVSDDGSQDGMDVNEEVQVDFEARAPSDQDFPGIKRLLQQLFLKAHIDLDELTNLVLQQNYIGSVIQQSAMSDGSDAEDDDDIFGITSVLNLTSKKDVACVQQLKTYLVSRCDASKDASNLKKLQSILNNDGAHVGFLISERFVNIPAQIAVPSYENLKKEIETAKAKKMQFDFSHYAILCKLYKPLTSGKKNVPSSETIYSNAEEELLEQEATLTFDYSVADESDAALSGKWDGDADEPMKPFRRLFVFEADKLDHFIQTMKINLT